MTEWVLLLWVLIPGTAISDPVEVGTYRHQDMCELQAALNADTSKTEAKQHAEIWRCVERDK